MLTLGVSCELTGTSDTLCVICMVQDIVAGTAGSSLNLLLLLPGYSAGPHVLVSIIVHFGHVTEM